MRFPFAGAGRLDKPTTPVREICRTSDDRAERFKRLQAEFNDNPDEAGRERLLEAFWSMKKAGQDPRCLSIDAELAALEREANRKIEQRRRADGLA